MQAILSGAMSGLSRGMQGLGPGSMTWRRLGPAALIAVAMLMAYSGTLLHLAGRWSREPDYSHGYFVPVFAAYLLWLRRDRLPAGTTGSIHGLWVIGAAMALKVAAAFWMYFILEPVSLIVCLFGLGLLGGGVAAVRWAWPAILFLGFMIPLPGACSELLAHPLQRMATISSTYCLQVLGVPAVAEGNVILLTSGKIGVVEACSGLRMLLVFFAVCTAAALVAARPIWEKVVMVLSAIPIAIAANVIRITSTGILHETIGGKAADAFFHDAGGWLMMPIALTLLVVEMRLLTNLTETETHEFLLGAR